MLVTEEDWIKKDVLLDAERLSFTGWNAGQALRVQVRSRGYYIPCRFR